VPVEANSSEVTTNEVQGQSRGSSSHLTAPEWFVFNQFLMRL
uniref:DNA-binding protein n=1 Tax=Ascaris lumbricoides TaxID=6252 RepID=A0A0M3IPW0_ASCLU